MSRMEQTVAALTAESAASWSFPARLLLAQSYCALGRVEPGAKMVAELRTRFGSTWRCSGRSCASPNHGWQPPREMSAAQSNWRWTPPEWPGNPGSRRSKCSRYTTPSATETDHVCHAWLRSPTRPVDGSRPRWQRTPLR